MLHRGVVASGGSPVPNRWMDTMHTPRRLYFAFGSNLNLAAMRSRCPDSVPLRTVAVCDWSLVFRGWLDIVPAPGRRLDGAIYRVSAADEAALDEYEGVSTGYYEQIRMPVPGTGEAAFAYRMLDGSQIFPPPADYYGIVEQGFRDWDLPLAPLEAALEQSCRAGGREAG